MDSTRERRKVGVPTIDGAPQVLVVVAAVVVLVVVVVVAAAVVVVVVVVVVEDRSLLQILPFRSCCVAGKD